MLPKEILRRTRKAQDLTLSAMGELLDTSNARIAQWEGGDPIPEERLFAWTKNESLPQWTRYMAWEMIIANLREKLKRNEDRIDELERTIGHPINPEASPN